LLTTVDLDAYERDGFVRIEGFASAEVCDAMLARVVELARLAADGVDISPPFVMPEEQADFRDRPATPEELVSKIFRLARDPVFEAFAASDTVVDLVGQVIPAVDLDCFLSQFIFKNRGAWGQPWHQDAYYFPFEPPRPVVGVWLAVTEANLENGCLHVLPGSHREPVATHVPDQRPDANYGYMEIVDHDVSASVPVLMQPGDLLLFDSHLMHRSTDNDSPGIRAAMVFHYAAADTVDRTEEFRGYTVNDWMPVRRG
jgi:ectoine hydroxylase-related dioxygenase (phytanoyl-CoA dioxygenase family)